MPLSRPGQAARRLAPYRAATQRSSDVETDESEAITSWAQLMNLGDIGNFNPASARRMRQGLDSFLCGARARLWFTTPYFVPDHHIQTRLLLPGLAQLTDPDPPAPSPLRTAARNYHRALDQLTQS